MKYNDTIELLKIAAKILIDPTSISNSLEKSEISKYSNDLDLNNSMDNNIYAGSESNINEYNKNAPMEDNKSYDDSISYNNYESNDYYKKQKNTSSNPQGVIDSITQELTSVRLQQAIILSEIVGKPRSKTRKKRRF